MSRPVAQHVDTEFAVTNEAKVHYLPESHASPIVQQTVVGGGHAALSPQPALFDGGSGRSHVFEVTGRQPPFRPISHGQASHSPSSAISQLNLNDENDENEEPQEEFKQTDPDPDCKNQQSPTHASEPDNCAICQFSLAQGQVASLGCGHSYHSECILQMSGAGVTACPICRARFAPEPSHEPDDHHYQDICSFCESHLDTDFRGNCGCKFHIVCFVQREQQCFPNIRRNGLHECPTCSNGFSRACNERLIRKLEIFTARELMRRDDNQPAPELLPLPDLPMPDDSKIYVPTIKDLSERKSELMKRYACVPKGNAFYHMPAESTVYKNISTYNARLSTNPLVAQDPIATYLHKLDKAALQFYGLKKLAEEAAKQRIVRRVDTDAVKDDLEEDIGRSLGQVRTTIAPRKRRRRRIIAEDDDEESVY